MPQLQYRILVDGFERFRLDLAYPDLLVCIEYDGQEFHDSAQARERDATRRKWLRDRGWIVIVVRKEDMGQVATHLWTNRLHDAVQLRSRLAG